MKKILLAIALAITAVPAFAQGTVNFDNLGVNAPFLDYDSAVLWVFSETDCDAGQTLPARPNRSRAAPVMPVQESCGY